MKKTTALDIYLSPLKPFLDDENVSEIIINRPNTVFIEKGGLLKPYSIDSLSYRHLEGLANLIASDTNQRLSEKEPLLSAMLPEGHRIQLVLPPACPSGTIILSIRKQVIKDISLAELAEQGLFDEIETCYIKNQRNQKKGRLSAHDEILRELFQEKDYEIALMKAIEYKKNILFAGGTSTGKTTLLNACLKIIPLHEHLITIEDVSELTPPHPLHTALFSSKGEQGTANVTPQDLIQASLRLRPDRIIMGELRGKEAADFIHATATGHDGSLSSLHASSVAIAFMRLSHMVQLNQHVNLSRETIEQDLHTVIDIVVQLSRKKTNEGYKRVISEMYFVYGE